jgi:Glycosyl transferases group 1/DUF based on E. rectale Gene description (DUF3880)
MNFGLVYDSTDSHITSRYLRQAIPGSDNIHFDLKTLKSNFDIEQFVGVAADRGTIPDVLLCEIGAPGLPRGLDRVFLPTAILDIDTFGWTPYRLRWSMLFDYVFTWHPSYVPQFQKAGHPKVFALPHAVDAGLFGDFIVDTERRYDIGFVGNRGLPQYRRRERVISNLAARFRTNDFNRHYSSQEMAEAYRRSKISVNVSRTEFPQEANMRCYEVMAAGALLMTGIPTELTEWGFREGEHFVGWRAEEEIPDLVDQFLRRKEERLAIARAGQERTLKDFTYQRCVESMVETLEGGKGQLFAPARQWLPEEVHLLYLSYYYRFGIPCAALEEFQHLRRAYPRAYWKGLPMVLKTLRHVVGGSLM